MTHAGYVFLGADLFGEQSISDFPGEDRRTLPFVLSDLEDDIVRGDSGLASPNRPWPNGSTFVVTTQNLAHTSVRHLQRNQPRIIGGTGHKEGTVEMF